MKLIKDKKFLQNIAHYIDGTNTIGGGVMHSQVRLQKRKKEAVLQVLLPGVEVDQIQAILDKNQLTVMALYRQEEHPALQVPLFHQSFALPANLDYAQIKVVHAGRELRVHLPYLPKGPKFLDIEQW